MPCRQGRTAQCGIVIKNSLPRIVLLLAACVSVTFAQTPNPAQSAPAPTPATKRPVADPINDAFYRLGPDSNPMEGVPHGKYTDAKTFPSQIFPGYQHTYHVYVPAQYDPAVPTPLIVFNDGQAMMAEPGDVQAHWVLDNLIFRREIPVMIAVFINPARRPEDPEPNPKNWGDKTTLRADEYNPPNDKYARVIVDELLPVLRKDYNITDDPDQRAMMGSSSGGIAAFGVAWFRPNEFRKVISFVGSFVDIRGGHQFAELVEASEKKPIRIFMEDGRNDLRQPDNPNRDWFLQNVRLMQVLQKKGYDLNYIWTIGNHGQKHGGAFFPEMMRWLWRDQPVSTDPADRVERSLRRPAPSRSQD